MGWSKGIIAVVLSFVSTIVVAPAHARTPAPGAPGARATWLPADKHGFGTAAARGSTVWFTLRASAMTEAYYPDLSTPSVRSLAFAVTDGKTFVQRDADLPGSVQRLDGLSFRQVVSDPAGRWRLTKTFITDPARDSVMVDVVLDSLAGTPLALYALLDPALSGFGRDDRGATRGGALVAWDRSMAVALAAQPAFTETSSGYAGRSDGWRDLRKRFRLGRRFDAPRPGNVVQTARLALDGVTARTVTLALGFGRRRAAARAAAAASLATGFTAAAAAYAQGWRDYRARLKPAPAAAAPVAAAYETSLLVLAAGEDKRRAGASIASPTTPWGARDYHAVRARDVYEIATARLAAGDADAARRALDFLITRQQRRDGHFPQSSTVAGRQLGSKVQLDQTALPIVLAWQLGRSDPKTWIRLRRAADYIVRRGPRSEQERSESQSGYSPATIAAEVAGLVCAADIARRNGDAKRAARYERVADRWQRAVQGWTATTNGPYVPKPYYLRLTRDGKPDKGTRYAIGDGGPRRADQRAIVDPSFLELVRLGVKPADEPAILNTLDVVDAHLGVLTPNGPFWHRFTFDGYGESLHGDPWAPSRAGSGATLGRAWPILAGERGEYALLRGQRPDSLLAAMAAAGNDGGMLPEQVWDGRPPTGASQSPAGEGTLSATPLAWTHAQLIRLAWSIDAGAPVEQPSIVACRYTGRCASARPAMGGGP
jgi:glucoamylase